MQTKPTTAAGYDAAQTSRVRATCLYVATKLGDLMDDVVVVGGLVPSLLIDQQQLAAGAAAHVGTMDLDIGLSVVLLDQERYKTLGERLRQANFRPDENDKGNPTRQRWVIDAEAKVTVDFLIAPTLAEDRGGGIRNLEPDFAAFIMPGLQLAFRDCVAVPLAGTTILGEQAKRTIHVCGPGAYVVLKALALRLRGENKDAYDLYYVLRNHALGVEHIAQATVPLLDDPSARDGLRYLKDEYAAVDAVGPTRTAQFLVGGPDDDIQAEALAYVRQLLTMIARLKEKAD